MFDLSPVDDPKLTLCSTIKTKILHLTKMENSASKSETEVERFEEKRQLAFSG